MFQSSCQPFLSFKFLFKFFPLPNYLKINSISQCVDSQKTRRKPCFATGKISQEAGQGGTVALSILARVSKFSPQWAANNTEIIDQTSQSSPSKLHAYLFGFYYNKLRARLKLNIISTFFTSSKRCNMLTSVLLSFNNRLLTL